MVLILILLLVAVIILGAAAGKPLGWIAIGFGVLDLLLLLLAKPLGLNL